MSDLELWAGVECSFVRVGDRYVDQLALTGHDARPGDLDRLAELGVRGVRYPVIWERIAPSPDRAPDWSSTDVMLGRLRALGIRPIVGLVHHGSGPRHTSLLEESFVTGLADFARMVAERYPWITDYTPVNEPLTTARFSALYGHWYPHARDDRAFVRALFVQCRAIREAMRAVRDVVPGARLVQTEDLATVFSTTRLSYQADFENARRFASLDLLSGVLDDAHPIRGWLEGVGADRETLASFLDEPCRPDVVGINHYVTSDRFLDERLERYPASAHGGNGREPYADVEAVRVLGAGIPGHRSLVELVSRRYGLPVAITEAHLGCAPEEQIRWLVEAWTAASEARSAGADVVAVTAWSAFGACDWDSLLTRPCGSYEPGLFDVRGAAVRPTALASVARDLARRGRTEHPLAGEPGWWRRPDRILYPAVGPVLAPRALSRRPILVTGGRGTLARAIERICAARGLSVVVRSRAELDISDREQLEGAIRVHSPWAVVNAAGYVRVDDAEADEIACMRANADAAALLAEICEQRGMRYATFSSDLVFDGAKRSPYLEDDAPSPLNAYGRSKLASERMVKERCAEALVVRTAAFFGPWDTANFVHRALAMLDGGARLVAIDDCFVSPTYVPDLADAVLTLLVDGASGVWHVANRGAVTWYELARFAAAAARISSARLEPRAAEELGLAAPRPHYSVLGSRRGALLRDLESAIEAYANAWRRGAPAWRTHDARTFTD